MSQHSVSTREHQLTLILVAIAGAERKIVAEALDQVRVRDEWCTVGNGIGGTIADQIMAVSKVYPRIGTYEN